MNVVLRTILCGSLLLLAACTPDHGDGESTDAHVWKAQTQALEKARDVEQLLQDAAEEKRRAMQQQTQ